MEQAVLAVLRYLVQHPEAKDTLDGIVRWWGLPVALEAQAENVHQGLEALIKQGWVVVRTSGAGIRLYGLNKDRIAEVTRFLNG
jgi:phosphoglucomutase